MYTATPQRFGSVSSKKVWVDKTFAVVMKKRSLVCFTLNLLSFILLVVVLSHTFHD